MSGPLRLGDIAGKRVLVLGRSPEVLETVMQALADQGLRVEGSIDAERAPEQLDARASTSSPSAAAFTARSPSG